MVTNTVNVEGLSRASVVFNNALRELPYFKINQIAKLLAFNIIAVQGEDIRINKRRKAGILRPYVKGLTLGQNQELIKFDEFKLKPEMVYAEIKDNILEYKEKKVLSNQGEWVDNKTKKHPLEFLILTDKVISFAEDIIFNLFFAERDVAIPTPATAFTGFFPKLDILQVAGEVSVAKGNLVNTGAFVKPTDDTDTEAYDKLVDFVASAHPLLKNRPCDLYAAEKPMEAARRAFHNMVRSHTYPTMEQMLASLRSDANCANLTWLTHPCLGNGDKLMMMDHTEKLLDVGVNNDSDKDFVQVRNPYPDPNEVQFWIQASYDTRFGDIHEKVFRTNDQSNTANNYAGDFRN